MLPIVEATVRVHGHAIRPRTLISRQASPFSRGGLESRLLRRAGWGVMTSMMRSGPIPGGVHRIFSQPAMWRRAVASADCVIAGSAFLADAAAEYNRNVVMIPSCVEPAEYHRLKGYECAPEPVLVWIGSPSTERYLQSITPALINVHRLRGGRLRVVSAGRRSLGPLEAMTDRVTWTPSSFASSLADADVGIGPLVDDAQARGKCAYKLLQYGAAALPVVGSPIGANASVLVSSTARADCPRRMVGRNAGDPR